MACPKGSTPRCRADHPARDVSHATPWTEPRVFDALRNVPADVRPAVAHGGCADATVPSRWR